MTSEGVLIVGAALAGVTVAERLRDRGYAGPVTLAGDERDLPYDRPPLSKACLTTTDGFGGRDGRPVRLRPVTWYGDHGIDVALGSHAVHLHPDRLEVQFADGTTRCARHVVVATGARARRLEHWPDHPDIHYLRTIADSERLTRSLSQPGDLIVIGAGFIGLEVAAAAVSRGWRVTVVEQARAPLARVLPGPVAELWSGLYRDRGVTFLCSEQAHDVVHREGRLEVRLDSGTVLTGTTIVVGVGALPNADWLAGAGVTVDNGVVCDSRGGSSRAGVWAAGDVARWPNAVTGRSDRVEQWTAAKDQGVVVADAILGGSVGWTSPPYFWSDAFGHKLQFVGHASLDHHAHVVRQGRRAVCVIGDERLRGVVTMSHPRRLAQGRRLLMDGASLEAACRWAEDAAMA